MLGYGIGPAPGWASTRYVMRVVLVRLWKRWAFDKNTTTQPLGLMYLAAALRRARPGDELFIVDSFVGHLGPEEAAREVCRLRPDVVGVGALTGEAPQSRRFFAQVKASCPSALTVLGGPHATTSPRRILADENLDVVVVGEGERTFVELCDRVAGGDRRPEIAGVAFRRGAGALAPIYSGAPRDPILALDDLPHPAWDLVDVPAYWREHTMNGMLKRARYMSIFTSRGCPYRCTYCHNVFGKRFQERSPEHVLSEIRELHERYGIEEIHILDDIFNANRERAKEIMRLLANSGMNLALAFPNGLRGDRMDSELIRLMRAAGTYKICYAVESASPRIQKLIRKHVDLSRLADVIAETSEAGILTHGFFMLGFPTERRDELDATVTWSRRSALHLANFFIVNPFEGTPIADTLRDEGIAFDYGDLEQYNYHEPKSSLAAVDAAELKAVWRRAYLGFYLDPHRAVRVLRDLPHLEMLPAWGRILASRALGMRRLLAS